MTKKGKIILTIGIAAAVGTIVYLVYNHFKEKNDAANALSKIQSTAPVSKQTALNKSGGKLTVSDVLSNVANEVPDIISVVQKAMQKQDS